MRTIELLAPAGGIQSVYASVRSGADAVYVGGRALSARAAAVNFTFDELCEAVRYCHLHGVKIYRAMNTVIFDREMEDFLQEVLASAKAGVDGLIVQDTGGAEICRRAVPDMPLHASTQMTVYSPSGVMLASEIGMRRVVAARELSLDEISALCGKGADIEVFVHGAQCMCLSGQCYMSAMIGSRSANRGRCAQSCRLPFNGCGSGGERHDLSLKDMSLLHHVDSLKKAGVSSFKIEGRMKRPEYVAAAVSAFRSALNGNADGKKGNDSSDEKRLRAVFSRSGFTDGYLTGKTGAEMFGFRSKEDVTAAAGVLDSLAAIYKDEIKDGNVSFDFSCISGKRSRLTYFCGSISGAVEGIVPEKARTRSITEEDVKKQLSKLGGTRYQAEKITCRIDEGLTLPAAELNRLRREAAEQLDSLTIDANTPKYSVACSFLPDFDDSCRSEKPVFRIMSDNAENIADIRHMADYIILPLKECEKIAARDNIIVNLPPFGTADEEIAPRLKALFKKGFTRFYCDDFSRAGLVRRTLPKAHIHGGGGLNITNSAALDKWRELGLSDAVVSPELKAGQIAGLKMSMPVGIAAYGRLPLMTVKNCPVKAACGGCKGCCHMITDRMGRHFPVVCGKGYARILNCHILNVCHRLDCFGGISFALIDLSGENRENARRIFALCQNGQKPQGEYTAGLYFRGVM